MENEPTIEEQKKVVEQIRKLCRLWNTMGFIFNILFVTLGITTITTSVFVSVYTGNDYKIFTYKIDSDTIKIVAYISTVSLTLLTAFNLINYANNSRNAWRALNVALMNYDAGVIKIDALIEEYKKCEVMMGNVNFNYGSP